MQAVPEEEGMQEEERLVIDLRVAKCPYMGV